MDDCDMIIRVQRHGESGYLVTCGDGQDRRGHQV